MLKLYKFIALPLFFAVFAGHAADGSEATEATHNHDEPVHKKNQHGALFRYSYDLSVTNDDNIRRAQNDVDIRSDLITSVTINAKGGSSVSNLSLLNYGASATYEAFSTFTNLNNINFNINARYRFAFSSGFTSPIYSLGVKLGGIESELEMRDSTWYSVAFQMNKWMTNTLNTTIGLNHRQRESKSEVFDTVESRFFVNFDLNLSRKALLYGTYTFISGDIVSSATPTLQFINWSEAIEPDDAFGGVAFNQFAYRLEADSNVITLGYNRIMTRSMSIDVSYRFIDSEAAGDVYYERQILRASLLGRF